MIQMIADLPEKKETRIMECHLIKYEKKERKKKRNVSLKFYSR